MNKRASGRPGETTLPQGIQMDTRVDLSSCNAGGLPVAPGERDKFRVLRVNWPLLGAILLSFLLWSSIFALFL
jgi:hypothetical protein